MRHTYDAAGRVKTLLYPNGFRCEYGYDEIGRLISKFTYYPPPSNAILTGYVITFPSDTITNITPYGLVSFPSGWPSSGGKFLYRADDALEKDSTGIYKNDSMGNRIMSIRQDDTIRYTWTIDPLLTSLTKQGITTTFGYDGLGHRVSRTKGADITHYVLNINGPVSLVLQTTDGNGALKANYIYGLGLLESIDTKDSVLFYHFDAWHSTVAITDIKDSVRATYVYSDGGVLHKKTGTLDQPHTFLGEYGVEQETDTCYYVRARYLDAYAERFLSKDPLFGNKYEPKSLNRYVYSFNNPFDYYDVSGLTGNKDDEGIYDQILRQTNEAIDEGREFEAILGIVSAMGYKAAEGVLFLAGGAEIRVLKSMTEIRAAASIISGAGKTLANEGIYEFISASGKKYVGQSGDIALRIEQHMASGKLLLKDKGTLKITEVLGGKTAREIAEQMKINNLGGLFKDGIKNLENIRNPIGPARQYLLPNIR